MNAGQLRHRIIVDEPVTTQDDTGAETVVWAVLDTVWGAIEPLNGRERLLAGGINATTDTRIRIRWSSLMEQVTPRCRLLHQGVIYNIESIAHIDMGRREIEIMATSGINTG